MATITRKEHNSTTLIYEAEISDDILALEENKDLSPEEIWEKYELNQEADLIREKDCGSEEEYELNDNEDED